MFFQIDAIVKEIVFQWVTNGEIYIMYEKGASATIVRMLADWLMQRDVTGCAVPGPGSPTEGRRPFPVWRLRSAGRGVQLRSDNWILVLTGPSILWIFPNSDRDGVILVWFDFLLDFIGGGLD